MSICAPRVLIAAPASATGKTTVACGLMRALVRRGLKVQACKSGPDYIDPMFHAEVVGATSRNLDLFFADAPLVRALLAKGARQADVTVIEGAMGYYDGIAGSAQASAWELAAKTDTPCVLVIDGRGRALSAAAEVTGFVRFRDPSNLRRHRQPRFCGVLPSPQEDHRRRDGRSCARVPARARRLRPGEQAPRVGNRLRGGGPA